MSGQSPAREPLVTAASVDHSNGLRTFLRKEFKVMFGIGWPILVSFFCRFAMFSMDSAFVGHISSSTGGQLPPGGGPLAAPLGLLNRLNGLNSLSGLSGLNGLNGLDGLGSLGGLGELASAGISAASGAAADHAAFAASPPGATKDYLAAASLSDMLSNLLVVPLLGMSFGLNPLISQAMGSGNHQMAGTWLQLCVFCSTLATIPLLVCFFYVGDMLRFLGFAEHLCEMSGVYAKFNSIWVLPNCWYVSLRYYFQAQGKARPAMYCGLVFLGFNALFAWVLVFGGPLHLWLGWPGLGFIGAAVSISLSRTLQCFFYWLVMFVIRAAHRATWPGMNWDFLHSEYVRAFLAQTIPQVGTLFLQFAIGQSTTLLVARLGTLAVASSSAASSAMMPFTLCFMATLSCVAAIRVGFHLGQGESLFAKRTAWATLALGVGSTFIFAAVLLPLRHQVMGVMTSDPEVRGLAVQLLPAVLLNYLAASIVQCGTSGILASQGRTRLSTALSLCLELPLSLGSIALLVLYFHVDVRVVYWVQASASVFEAFVVIIIVLHSDWDRYAMEAQQRQQASRRRSRVETPEVLEECRQASNCAVGCAVSSSSSQTEDQSSRTEKGEVAPAPIQDIRKAGG